jgi:hypothetical protein
MNLFVFDEDKKLQIKLAGAVAANQLHWTAHGISNSSGTQTPVSYAGVTNSTTEVDITSVPSAGTQVIIKQVTVYNTDTANATFYLILDDNSTQYTIAKVTLQTGKWSMISPDEDAANETDPIFTASDAYGITSGDISNWNTAYGWGDWSGEGFITAADVPSKAAGTDVDTGTDDDKYVTSKAIADSDVAFTDDVLDAQQEMVGINAQTSTSYTLAASDAGKLVTCNNASDITVTIPKNSAVAIPTNVVITLQQIGDGVITVKPVDGDVTLTGYDGYKTAGKYAAVQLIKTATDVWTMIGGVS